ncbi:MAG: GNAT family N-acetyltransferase [Myxococcales bacterium]|nr:GNAT family N-acetyltransferase [Myxococcales bacterium]
MQELNPQPGTLETDHVEVRNLRAEDLDWIIRVDSQHSGKQRREYYKVKLAEVAKDTGIKISLAAFIKGEPAGFLMGRLYYGEFGQPEPIASLDSLGVSTVFAGQHVGAALMRQLEMNLAALGIERLQTQIEWDQVDLIKFFQRAGFEPAARICLEKVVRRPVG